MDVQTFQAKHTSATGTTYLGTHLKLKTINQKRRREVRMEKEAKVKKPSLNSILDAVSERFAISQEQIKGECRVHELVVARFAFFYIANKLFGYSTPRIGAFLNDRDHTTVMNGVKKAKLRLTRDKTYKENMAIVEKRSHEINEQKRIESFVDDTQAVIDWDELGKHRTQPVRKSDLSPARKQWLFGQPAPWNNTKPIKVVRKQAKK
jgi:delta 1-pyrroline-5-carboxylate dehydrogenase